jgi:hypothetical protein
MISFYEMNSFMLQSWFYDMNSFVLNSWLMYQLQLYVQINSGAASCAGQQHAAASQPRHRLAACSGHPPASSVQRPATCAAASQVSGQQPGR